MSALDRVMEPLREKLDSALRRGQQRFMALNPRERKIVGIGGVLSALILIWLLIWAPLTGAHDNRVENLRLQRDIAQKLEVAAAKLSSAPQTRRRAPVQGGPAQSLLALVDQAAKSGTLGKAPDRLQPESDNEVRVWLTGVEFDALLRWLRELQDRHGIVVGTLDIERGTAPGSVNARLALTRSGP